MSNKSNSKNQTKSSSLVNFTNPSVIPSSLFFSLEINTKEEYFDFINQAQENILLMRDMIMKSKVIAGRVYKTLLKYAEETQMMVL